MPTVPESTSPIKIDAKRLRGLLRNPPPEILHIEDSIESIRLPGYVIEDEFIVLDDSVQVNRPLNFLNCSFKSDTPVYIQGLVCKESVTFEACTFKEGIYFSEGTFDKAVSFLYGYPKKIHLTGGAFNEINISSYDLDDVWVSRAKYEKLVIGEHLKGDNIKKLVIFNNEGESGTISVLEQSFDEISLNGHNSGKNIYFSKVKADIVSIADFDTNGQLNFYGLKAKNLNNSHRYFQLVNCNLKNTQFSKTFFSQYKELIIINSFITDASFICCSWSHNVRAIYGPGYEMFESSLKTGRNINNDEVVHIKDAYRQLKIVMSKHNDKILEHAFYAEELNYHNKSLSWTPPWKNNFWDKLILHFSRVLSNYGQSVGKPIFWLLAGHLILFLITLLFHGFDPLQISWKNASEEGFKIAFEKYFIFINPLRGTEISLPGYLIVVDILMRIWSSYMIYNVIRASRRFIS